MSSAAYRDVVNIARQIKKRAPPGNCAKWNVCLHRASIYRKKQLLRREKPIERKQLVNALLTAKRNIKQQYRPNPNPLSKKCTNDLDGITNAPPEEKESIIFVIETPARIHRECIDRDMLYAWWMQKGRGIVKGNCMYYMDGVPYSCDKMYHLPLTTGVRYIDSTSHKQVMNNPNQQSWKVILKGTFVRGQKMIGIDPVIQQQRKDQDTFSLYRLAPVV